MNLKQFRSASLAFAFLSNTLVGCTDWVVVSKLNAHEKSIILAGPRFQACIKENQSKGKLFLVAVEICKVGLPNGTLVRMPTLNRFSLADSGDTALPSVERSKQVFDECMAEIYSSRRPADVNDVDQSLKRCRAYYPKCSCTLSPLLQDGKPAYQEIPLESYDQLRLRALIPS